MKNTFKPALFVLLMCGVFGADEDKMKAVMEGDFVTLNPDRTHGFNAIQWQFKNQTIAYIRGGKPTYAEHMKFRGRLQLNQTGSLNITNMRTKHSGVYRLWIDLNTGLSHVDYTVTVYECPAVINAIKGEMKFISVKEGDPVTLQTDVTDPHGDELIVWRFGKEGKLIAKADIEAKSSPLYDTDERFRDRLKIENNTGSLIITNTRTTDSGLYTVKISDTQILYKRFAVNVTVPVSDPEAGLSAAAVAGIAVVVVLLVAAALVFYYRHKISELLKQTLPVSVTEGEDVTLKADTKINNGDMIQWYFGDKEQRIPIVEIKGESREPFLYDKHADGRFRDILYLDETTGSLTIRNSRPAHSGLYKLEIRSSSGGASQQTFIVTVNENVKVKIVKKEDIVTLKPDAEIQRDDQILWMFGDQDSVIAQIKEGNRETYDGPDGRFRDRLELDETTASLTIKNITPQHTGLYKLLTISSRGTLWKKFRILKQNEHKVTVGESVQLKTGLLKMETDDETQWLFGDKNTLIAEIKGGIVKPYDGPGGIFRDRLELNNQTGDLTIKDSTFQHAGYYKLKICSSKGNINWIYSVTIRGNPVNVSATVEMPLLNEEVPGGVNAQEGTSSL